MMAYSMVAKSRVLTWVGRIFLLVVPPLVFFAAAEISCWMAGVELLADNKTHAHGEFMQRCRSSQQLIDKRCYPATSARGAAPNSVYVLGGSSVQGHPVGQRPFAGYMQELLDQRFPGSYHVRNLGAACRDSIYVRKCTQMLGGDSSDIYVIYSGHNNFANIMVPNPRLRILSEEYPVLSSAPRILSRSYFYSMLSQLVRGVPSEAGWVWQRLPEPQWSSAKKIALDKFTEDLDVVIEKAGKSGITILMVTVVSNISEYPIKKENWDQLAKLSFPESMADWRSHYEMGVRLYREGRFEESLLEFTAARESSLGGRAPSSLNETVRRMTEIHPHVHLVDFETTLWKLGVEEGIIGCNFFGTSESCDQFHPNPRTHELIAKQVVEAIVQLRARGDQASR